MFAAWLLTFCLARGTDLNCYFVSLYEVQYFLVYRMCDIQLLAVAYERCPKFRCGERLQATVCGFGMDEALVEHTLCILLGRTHLGSLWCFLAKLEHNEGDCAEWTKA